MTDARVLLAFAALCVLALWYVCAGVKASLAPLCALGSAVVWFSAFGMAGLLRVGGWLFYLVCAGAAVFLVVRRLARISSQTACACASVRRRICQPPRMKAAFSTTATAM